MDSLKLRAYARLISILEEFGITLDPQLGLVIDWTIAPTTIELHFHPPATVLIGQFGDALPLFGYNDIQLLSPNAFRVIAAALEEALQYWRGMEADGERIANLFYKYGVFDGYGQVFKAIEWKAESIELVITLPDQTTITIHPDMGIEYPGAIVMNSDSFAALVHEFLFLTNTAR